ncbi:hypothetical protein GO730_12855 [Spirosoma sp. HMF3257]|uniref:Dual OB-containing domain-containing protein n=1 Tax=Spirosoma telluris TaxID=2183553 RepID=A0A327NIA1_9BACT|nr:hypothetical protein [Spirosoma telluris]RAI74887.1 hypothetical protein HMF3257_12770 [Spirosoma telluris]
MEILIVSKTHMANNACVGGIVLLTNESIRLLNPGNQNQPTDTDFEIGEVWDIRFIHRNPVIPPHNEDVIILEKKYVRKEQNLTTIIKDRGLINCQGSIENLYDGLLNWTHNGSGYITPNGNLPQRSTLFWLSDRNLECYESFNKNRYRYPNEGTNRNFSFVGYQNIVEVIPAGTIIRVSLTRPFVANGVEGLWAQLSGWYL